MTTEAMNHLGNVLSLLAELHEDDRCEALDEALAFYNAENPNQQIVPVEGYTTRLVQRGPLDDALESIGTAP